MSEYAFASAGEAAQGEVRVITGGMERFVLLDHLCEQTGETLPDRMTACTSLVQAPVCLAAECMAQCAGLHLRTSIGFSRHVFVLAVRSLMYAVSVCATDASVPFALSGVLVSSVLQTGRSDTGASYLAECVLHSPAPAACAENTPCTGLPPACGSIPVASGELLLSTVPYSGQFLERVLRPHYEALHRRLRNAACPLAGNMCGGIAPLPERA